MMVRICTGCNGLILSTRWWEHADGTRFHHRCYKSFVYGMGIGRMSNVSSKREN